MSRANPLWGSPRIQGELAKLGIDMAKSTVEKYMARGRKPPSPTWRSFLQNHLGGIAAIDFRRRADGNVPRPFRVCGAVVRPTPDRALQRDGAPERGMDRAANRELLSGRRRAEDAPEHRPVERRGKVIAIPHVGGLHHRYARLAA
jgi:hypothetical protein